jgi:hypothetical protein
MSTSEDKVLPDVAGVNDKEVRDTIIQAQKSLAISAQRTKMAKETPDIVQASVAKWKLASRAGFRLRPAALVWRLLSQ